MPRYFFDIKDSDGTFVDEVGLELPNMDAAIREARKALADLVREALREVEHDAVAIAIRDGADGPVVVSVNLTTIPPQNLNPRETSD